MCIRDRVQIVGIGWNGTQDEINSFIDRHGLTFTNVRDPDGSIFSGFGVPGQPAWVFQSASGERKVSIGALSEDKVEESLLRIAAS